MSVGRFVDVEGLVVAVYTLKLPDVLPVTQLPSNIEGQELIRVTRSPGSNDNTSALPRVDVECFAPNRARMWILAGQANNALAELSGDLIEFEVDDDGTTDTVQINTVHTVTDPVAGFWSPTVQRSVAVYELDLNLNPLI